MTCTLIDNHNLEGIKKSRSEIEAQECEANGHQWTNSTYCKHCGDILEVLEPNDRYQIDGSEGKCNEGKHFFINSEFCDRCNICFDDWYAETIRKAQKGATAFLLSVLHAIVKEQVQTRSLRHKTGSYIIDAIKDQATKKGWLE